MTETVSSLRGCFVFSREERRCCPQNGALSLRGRQGAAIHIIHASTWRKVDCFTAFAMTGEGGGDDRNCFVIARRFRFWQRGTPSSPTKWSLVIARQFIAAAIHIIHASTWRKPDCFTAFAMTGEGGVMTETVSSLRGDLSPRQSITALDNSNIIER